MQHFETQQNAECSVSLSLLLNKTLRFVKKKKNEERKRSPHKTLCFDEGIFVFLFDFIKSDS